MRTRTKIGLSILAVVCAVLLVRWWDRWAIVGAVRAASTASEVAEAVVGENLKDLPVGAHGRVLDALRELTGKDEYWREYRDGSPHRLFRWNGGATRWVLVVTYEGMNVPDASWMAVHQFDASWNETSVINFPTGYRIALFDVWKEEFDAVPEPMIVVRLGSVGSFGDYSYRQRQYYSVRDGRVAMIRIEEEGGGLERAIFSASHPWNGPALPDRSVDEWVRLLTSDDTVDVLEALTWLGGSHVAYSEQRDAGVNQESVEDSLLWERVRDDPRVGESLTALLRSANGWVTAAAALASVRDDLSGK